MRLAEATPELTPELASGPAAHAAPPEAYDVLLLAGTPRRSSCVLPVDIAAGDIVVVDGESWTVADVRKTELGPTRLICIYAV